MNRCNACFSSLPSRRQLLLGILAATLLGQFAPASAQINVRPFPQNAQRAVMAVTYPPIIQLNGRPERLSPGARIRGQNNLLQLSGSLVGQNLLVNFVRTPSGEVHEVWILTEAEAALKLPTEP
jgi:hypothetical protein